MANVHQAPDWQAFQVASNRIRQSSAQVAQGLQAAVSIPGDLDVVSTQLQPIELQPTNAALNQQMIQMRLELRNGFDALNQNMTARMLNGFLQSDTEALTPLVTPHTNAPIANFPATSAALGRMTWLQKRALGIGLGLTAPANNATAAQQRTFLVQIRVAVGLRPSPA